MVRRKAVSFWARKPVKTKVCFRTNDGRNVCFKARVPKRVKVRFKSRK